MKKPSIAIMLGHAPEHDEEEDGEDYESTPEMERLAKQLIVAVRAEDPAGVVKAFCALADEHEGRDELRSDRNSKEHENEEDRGGSGWQNQQRPQDRGKDAGY